MNTEKQLSERLIFPQHLEAIRLLEKDHIFYFYFLTFEYIN